MPVELKTCPFCGGKAEVIRGWVFGNKRPKFKVYCKRCQVRQILVKQRYVAVSNWNQRAKQVEEKFTFDIKFIIRKMQMKFEMLQDKLMETIKEYYPNDKMDMREIFLALKILELSLQATFFHTVVEGIFESKELAQQHLTKQGSWPTEISAIADSLDDMNQVSVYDRNKINQHIAALRKLLPC